MIYILLTFLLVLLTAVFLKKPKPEFISVAMIVWNEEKFLRDCLESLKLIPNKEIIIGVDSRTTDATREIAREYTDNVFDFEWTDHYANARNIGIEKCKGDYVLIIDGDEILKKWVEPTGEYSLMQVNNLNSVAECKNAHFSVRIFKNGRGYKYHWRTHETLEPSLKNNNGTLNLSIIEHHGFEYGKDEWEKKTNEHLEAHFKQLSEEPENQSVKFHISLCYYRIEEYDEALQWAILSLFDNISNETRAANCITVYQCYQKLQREDLGGWWLWNSLTYLKEQIHARVLLADYTFRCNRKDITFDQLNEVRKVIKNKISRLPNDYLITEAQLNKLEEGYKNAI